MARKGQKWLYMAGKSRVAESWEPGNKVPAIIGLFSRNSTLDKRIEQWNFGCKCP